MKTPRLLLNRLRRDENGVAMVEFALLGSLFLAMLIGIFQIAILMQNYNALRSAGDDLSRYVVVQYQKGATLSQDQIQSMAINIGASKPYFLNSANMDISSTQGTSDMTGASKITLSLSYKSADLLQFFGIHGVTLKYKRDLYVPA